MNNNKLTELTNPKILKSIGANRLNLLLHKFAQPISVANAVLPTPDAERPESFTELAAALGTQVLPPELEQTLQAVETAALPQNAAWLEDARLRRIPCVSVPSLKIDLALEIFFAAPDELPALNLHGVPALAGQIRHPQTTTIRNSLLTIRQHPSSVPRLLIPR